MECTGVALAGPNDPFVYAGTLTQLSVPTTGIVSVIIEGYHKTTAYRSGGFCVTADQEPVTLPTPYTFSTTGVGVTYGNIVLSAAGGALGQRYGLATCVYNFDVGVDTITKAADLALLSTAITARKPTTSSSSRHTTTPASLSQTTRGGSWMPSPTGSSSLSKATANGSQLPQATALKSVPDTNSSNSSSNIALIAGSVGPVVSLSILAFLIVLWRKRRRRLQAQKSGAQKSYSLDSKPELHAEEVTSPISASKDREWHETQSSDLRYELGDGEREASRWKDNHVVKSVSPIPELRGGETNYEMEA